MKTLEEYTIKEVVAMGYKVILEGPVIGKVPDGVTYYVSSYGNSHITEPIDTNKYIKKPHKGEDK